MPKRNPPNPKPYAKLPPNVRRMLMRRDAEIEWLQQAIGRRESQLRYQRDQYNRLAAELAAIKRGPTLRTQVSEPLPPVETKAGPTWMGVTTKVAATAPDPAPQAGAVVVNSQAYPAWLDEAQWRPTRKDHQWSYCFVDSVGDVQIWTALRDQPTTLPAMPAMTLAPEQVFKNRVAWAWLYWRSQGKTLTCTGGGDTLEGRKALLGAEAVVVWTSFFGCDASMWLAPPSLADVRVPPVTWRPA